MYQQINLYQPVFRRQEKVFSAVTLLQISAAAALLLLLIAGHAHWTLAGLERTAAALEQQLDHLDGQLGQLTAETGKPRAANLDRQIADVEADIGQRQRLLARVDRLTSRHSGGFADRLEALAAVQVPGLRLEDIRIDADRHIELRGTAGEARQVTAYLRGLERQATLSAYAFDTLSLQYLDDHQPRIRFVLRNFPGEATGQ